MQKLTISVDDDVYTGLQRVIGPRKISKFLNDLARARVVESSLDASYAALAADEGEQAEAQEWSEAMIGDVANG